MDTPKDSQMSLPDKDGLLLRTEVYSNLERAVDLVQKLNEETERYKMSVAEAEGWIAKKDAGVHKLGEEKKEMERQLDEEKIKNEELLKENVGLQEQFINSQEVQKSMRVEMISLTENVSTLHQKIGTTEIYVRRLEETNKMKEKEVLQLTENISEKDVQLMQLKERLADVEAMKAKEKKHKRHREDQDGGKKKRAKKDKKEKRGEDQLVRPEDL